MGEPRVRLRDALALLPDEATLPVAWVREALAAEAAAPTSVRATEAPPQQGADLLTADEAALRLGVKPKWLYRNAAKLPFTRRIAPRTLRFDPQGLTRWVARRG